MLRAVCRTMVPRTLRLTTIPSTSGPPIGDLENSQLIDDQRRRREVPLKFWEWGAFFDTRLIPSYELFDRLTFFKITAPFNNMRTQKFKAQLTNTFFATANQMFGGSYQFPTTAESAVIKSLSTVQTTKQSSAVVGTREEPPNI